MFAPLLVRLPLIIVWIIGLILALSFWRRHPRVSLLTTIATIGLLVTDLITVYANVTIPLVLTQQDSSPQQIGMTLAIIGIVAALINAGLFGLLWVAIFGWRERRETSSEEKRHASS